MTFVYPLLLGGLLLAGLPVLLHFLIRQKPKTLPFPAFRFLLQKRRSNTRNLRLRHLLLLLLRVALVVLVCLALARPRLFQDQLGILPKEKPIALVLVFDTSPSMGYKSGDMTRLELAKKRCLELLDQLPDDGRVLILDTSALAGFGREDWLRSLEKARQRVNSLTIQPNSVAVTKGIDEAVRRFDEWDRSGDDPTGQAMPRFVCIFSDRTTASWDSGGTAKRGTPQDDAVKVQILYFDVGIDEPVDVAIVQAELVSDRQSFTRGEKVPLRVGVKATGKAMHNTLLVEIAKRKVSSQGFDVEAGKEQTFALEIDTAALDAGLHQAEVRLETAEDALPFNNKRFVTFEIQSRQKILVLTDDLANAKTFVGALTALLYDVTVQPAADMAKLNGFDAVFLFSVAAPPEPLWTSLADYVKGGGGLGIIPPGDELDRNAYNSDASQKVMPAIISKKIERPEGQECTWSILDHVQHPFLALYVKGIAEDWDFIRYPRHASKFWEVKPRKDAVAIVHYDQKSPAVVEWRPKGKVLLLTTPLDERTPAWNNYDEKLRYFYLALPLMCAKYLCPESAARTFNYQFGLTPPILEKAPGWAYSKYLLRTGELSEEIQFDDKGRWVGERLPRAGNYTLAGTNPEKSETKELRWFSANIAGAESDLGRVPASAIEAALGKDSLVPQDRHKSLVDTLNWNEPMELFPWLMVLLLFLLAVENLLANKFYRQEPAAENSNANLATDGTQMKHG